MSADPTDSAHFSSRSAHAVPRCVAVIDVGATSIRMEIAQIDSAGDIQTLTRLVRPIDLGKEAFTTRRFSRASIEQTAAILKSYRQVTREFGIDSIDQIRVVATSAVREATNRLQFLDRVFIATGLQIQIIDEAEVNWITYMGIQPHLNSNPELHAAKSLVVEVGGGSTELLLIRSGNVLASETYRLGAIRLAQLLETLGAPISKRRSLMESQIGRTVSQIRESVRVDMPVEVISIGGDIRFAAGLIKPDWDREGLVTLALGKLERLTNQVIELDEDQLVRRFGLSFSEVETFAPALLTYLMIGKAFGKKSIYVSDTNLRDGLLHEIAAKVSLIATFRNQIIRSATSLGRRFDFDEVFAKHTAELASRLFVLLEEEHQLDRRYEVVLHLGALLHEIGYAINDRSNHKHAMYIVRNSEIFGLAQREVLLTALLTRYHRRASPQPSHEGYATLDLNHRVIVCKLAAILRLAIALNASRSGRIKDICCQIEGNRVVINTPGISDVALEQLAIQQNRALFEDVFGKSVLLRPTR